MEIKKINENFKPEALADILKDNFNLKSTTRSMAIYMITNNKMGLTQDQIATVVQLIKHSFGQMCNTSGSCIAWYKQDMRKKGNSEGIKSSFTSYLRTLKEQTRNKILINLANKHLDTLIKVADSEKLEKYISIKDIVEVKPTRTQIKVAKQEIEATETIAKKPKNTNTISKERIRIKVK